MKIPNISSMRKWVNNFFPGVQGESQDFLQLVRQSDNQVLGWIDENGQGQGSLAVPLVGGRFLQGSGNDSEYVIASGTFIDVDATNLKTTITIPVGSLLIAFASFPVFSALGAPYYLAVAIDGVVINQNFSNGDAEALNGGLYSFSSSFVGDGNSHTVSLQAASNSADNSLTLSNYANVGPIPPGPRLLVPTLSLILVPSI